MPRTSPSSPAVVVDDLSFAWPDGVPVLDHLSCTFPTARTGLVGANGSGKSTLLRLIAGDLRPDAGTVRAVGTVGFVHQQVAERADATVADLLGIAPLRSALRAIEAGSLEPAHFDTLGDAWDIEPRAVGVLQALGLDAGDDLLDRPATSLSGGRATQVALAGAQLAGWDVTLLDEPTNNLDARSRARVYDAVSGWPGVLIVVSHDRELLERVEAIVDLDARGVRTFGGPFSEYRAYRDQLQAAAERQLRDADADLARAKAQARAEVEREQQRNRSARRERAKGNVSKGAADYFANRSEKNSGSKSQLHSAALERAGAARAEADAAARTADPIRVDLPDTTVPAGKQVLGLEVGGIRLDLVGPERIRLTGANGSGKSTLLAWALGDLEVGEPDAYPASVLGDARIATPVGVPVGWLRQRTDELDRFDTVLEAVRDAAPDRTPHEARALLARFQLTRDAPLQPPSTLSGGERFRVALARVLFADPAPQLLVLDEPTNNLDLDSVDQLVSALADYRGALIVVTHDDHLAGALEVHREWHVEPGPRITDRIA